MQLGATNLSVPASLNRHFTWTLREDAEQLDRARLLVPDAPSTCYAVGAASGGTPWYGKFLPSGAWGAVNTFFKSTDGGQTLVPVEQRHVLDRVHEQLDVHHRRRRRS